jgi:hypothetical protein
MSPDHLLGHCRPTVVRVTEDDQVGAQFIRSLEDDGRDVVLGGVDELPVRGDPGCGEPVDGARHHRVLIGSDVVIAIEDAEPGPGGDVLDDHVAARDVEVDRPTVIFANRPVLSRKSSGEPGDPSMAASICSYTVLTTLSTFADPGPSPSRSRGRS